MGGKGTSCVNHYVAQLLEGTMMDGIFMDFVPEVDDGLIEICLQTQYFHTRFPC